MEHDQATVKAVIAATLEKVNEILSEHSAAEMDEDAARSALAAAEVRKQAAIARYGDCHVTARLFGFDLMAEWEAMRERERQTIFGPPPEPVQSPNMLMAALPAEKPKSIRERVIDAARIAHPGPVRAASIKHHLAEQGIPTHDKTIGMTLYRLLRQGVMRRKGWDWYFVPETERQDAVDPQAEESPGSDPELSFNAAE